MIDLQDQTLKALATWSCEGCQTNNNLIAEFPRMRQCAKAGREEEGCNLTSVYQAHSNAYIKITYAL